MAAVMVVGWASAPFCMCAVVRRQAQAMMMVIHLTAPTQSSPSH